MKKIRITKITKMAIIALSLVSIAALSTACGSSSDDKKESKTSTSTNTKTVKVSLKDDVSGMSVTPASIEVEAGTNLKLVVTNDGTVVHNLSTEDGKFKTADLTPFSSADLEIGKVEKSTELNCAIPGHKEAGMFMNIVVK
ncbi:MAG: cupredoxin domain-containing protein [Acidimicrobiia bacterium]|nr:cupredoxin domain-containing protein [Acidimicrobiia bacterium]